jgi:hypothetical protein
MKDAQARVRFEGSQPILRVEDMQASLRFLCRPAGVHQRELGL